MTAIAGLDIVGAHVASVAHDARATRCVVVAQTADRRRIYMRLDSHDAVCIFSSVLQGDDATWPPLFHRLATFPVDGPHVALRLDAAPAEADSSVAPWSILPDFASDDEITWFEELLGYVTLATELTLGESKAGASEMMLASLRSHALIVTRGDGALFMAETTAGNALTSLRTSIAEYYTSNDWEHVRLQLDGSIINDVSRDTVTFKIFRTPRLVGLEFRPDDDTGSHPFRTFPGSRRDEFGPVYRVSVDILSGELTLPEAETLTAADGALIDAIADALYPTMRAATIGVGHLDDRTYAGWTGSGAAFSAAYKAARTLGT